MVSNYKLYVSRAKNESKISFLILKLSNDFSLQKNIGLHSPETYYSATINHAYYSIFYMAKAYLQKHNIETSAPDEHKKTFNQFKYLVEIGQVDSELLLLYEDVLIKADTLLGMFQLEKKNRGLFTYKKLPDSNKLVAEKSLDNAKIFFKHIFALL